MIKILIMPILETDTPVFSLSPLGRSMLLKGLASKIVIDSGFQIR